MENCSTTLVESQDIAYVQPIIGMSQRQYINNVIVPSWYPSAVNDHRCWVETSQEPIGTKKYPTDVMMPKARKHIDSIQRSPKRWKKFLKLTRTYAEDPDEVLRQLYLDQNSQNSLIRTAHSFPTLRPKAYHGVAGEILKTIEPH